jgi:hypothetical protein
MGMPRLGFDCSRLVQAAFSKKLTVRVALNNRAWMPGLQRMSNERELDQFIELWTPIQAVTLTNAADSVSWNNTADGMYSARSGYEFQLHGRIRIPQLEHGK